MESEQELGATWQEKLKTEHESLDELKRAVEKAAWAKIRQLQALIDMRMAQGADEHSREIKRIRHEIQVLNHNVRTSSRFAYEVVNTSWWRRYIA